MVKRQGGNSGKGGKGGGKGTNWTPYLIAIAVVALALCFYSFPEEKVVKQRKQTGKSADQLDQQIRAMHAGLVSVSSTGTSGVFQKIKLMADQAAKVLEAADAAESEEERQKILEEGLEKKEDWLSVLTDHTAALKAEDEAEKKENAPFVPDASGNVHSLTAESFTDFVSSNSHTMIEFYAPWCGHCKKLAPEYELVAEQFKGRVGFAAVDATKEKQLARIYDVSRYPTLKWMVNGRAIDHSGPLTAAALSKWVENRLEPAYAELDAGEDVSDALKASGDTKAKLCAGSGKRGSKVHQAFEVLAENFRGKLVFIWSEIEAEDAASIRFFKGQQDPETCGGPAEDDALAAATAAASGDEEAAAGNSGAGCSTGEEAIKWLETKLASTNEE